MKPKSELDEVPVISRTRVPGATVVNAPYSADETTTTTQTLPDGNRIVTASAAKVYRDRLGRTRLVRADGISIVDPVARVWHEIDSVTHVVTSRGISVIPEKMLELQVKVEEYAAEQPANADRRREDLGVSTMAGIEVTGTRTTRVIPAGSIGNEREIKVVDERWYSPDLKIYLMTKHSDPRSGETVFQVRKLTRGDPDPSLFRVAEKDETRPGTITLGMAK